eukprot:COSAG01_NODE_32732_length_576_cov_1.222222_1_plen_68_part_10
MLVAAAVLLAPARAQQVDVVVTTLAGSGSAGFADATGTSAQFNQPFDVTLSLDGSFALVADWDGHRVR